MIELLISGCVSVILTTVIFAIRPLREAFFAVLNTVMDGPRRLFVGLAYSLAGRTNPRSFEMSLQERERISAIKRRRQADDLRQLMLKGDLEFQKRQDQHINSLRAWQEEFIRLADPESYEKFIAPKKVDTSFSYLGVHGEAERAARRES